jgi:SAM-dependent methyltransferase
VVKIYLTYGTEGREGFEAKTPVSIGALPDESVDEIQAENVLEKVPELHRFIEDCYRVLRPGGKVIFSSPFYASAGAWRSPLTVRGVGEQSLNWANKKWREDNKFTELNLICNFEVQGQFAIEETWMQKSDEAKSFAMQRYLNVVQAILFTLVKDV